MLILLAVIERVPALHMFHIEPVDKRCKPGVGIIGAGGFEPAHELIIHGVEVRASILQLRGSINTVAVINGHIPAALGVVRVVNHSGPRRKRKGRQGIGFAGCGCCGF